VTPSTFASIALALLILTTPLAAVAQDEKQKAQPLRAGLIGLDTSHVIAFTKVLNAPDAKPEVSGVKVVAAYPGGSPDLPSSRDRVEGYTKQMRDEFGVEIVDSIEALLPKVDVVLLESVDGRPHLRQIEPVLRAKKPVFIDKPAAGSLADVIRIYEMAEKAGVPVFSSSSLRFSPSIAAMRRSEQAGDVIGCESWGPSPTEEHHPDLFWYGIHGVESLYTVMGTGCESVTRTKTDGTDLVVGTWKGGRVGTFRGIRDGKADYGVLVFGSKGIVPSMGYGGYEPLLVEICKFFRTGQPPVPAAETIELFAFMEAADESHRRGGAPVTIAEVMEKARAEIAASVSK
jgi:predicted dehydrogenase